MTQQLFARKEADGWLVYDAAKRKYEIQSELSEPSSYQTVDNPLLGKHSNKFSFPLKFFLNITKRCNLFCSHCYNSSGEIGAPQLKMADIERLLLYCRSRGIFKITISGGEPTVHSQFVDVISLAGSLGLSVSIVTNGLLLHRKKILEAVGSSAISGLTVSLDGAAAKTHDEIRGEGAFEKALRGIVAARRVLHGTLSVRCSVSNTSVDEVPSLLRMLAPLGVDEVKLNPINPYGRAREMGGLDGARELLMSRLSDFQLLAEELQIDLELPGNKYKTNWGTCTGGKEYCEIDSDGSLYPCSFSWGNLKYGSIVEQSTDGLDLIFLSLSNHALTNRVCRACPARG